MPLVKGQKPKGNKGGYNRKTVKKSKHVQANLHPQYKEEASAIAWYEKQLKEGYTPRQILCDAFNRASGSTPEMFPVDRDDLIMRKLQELENLILSSVIDALNDIKNNPVARQDFVNDMNDGGNQVNNDTKQNLLNAVTSYRRNSRGE